MNFIAVWFVSSIPFMWVSDIFLFWNYSENRLVLNGKSDIYDFWILVVMCLNQRIVQILARCYLFLLPLGTAVYSGWNISASSSKMIDRTVMIKGNLFAFTYR